MKIDIEKVKNRMQALKITEVELGRRMDSSRQFIHQLLEGDAGRTLKIVTRLAEALEFPDPRDILIVE